MSERFIKCIISEKADWLAEKHPWAFMLLWQIAKRARRISGHIDGKQIGDAEIGDWKKIGMPTPDTYRYALEILIKYKFVEKVKTCRNWKNAPTSSPTKGTLVRLIDSSIWDINPEINPDVHTELTPTSPRLHPDEQERTRKNNKEEEQTTLQELTSDNIGYKEIILKPTENDCLFAFLKDEKLGLSLASQESLSQEFQLHPEALEWAIKKLTKAKNIRNPGGYLRRMAQEWLKKYENFQHAKHIYEKHKSNFTQTKSLKASTNFCSVFGENLEENPTKVHYELDNQPFKEILESSMRKAGIL